MSVNEDKEPEFITAALGWTPKENLHPSDMDVDKTLGTGKQVYSKETDISNEEHFPRFFAVDLTEGVKFRVLSAYNVYDLAKQYSTSLSRLPALFTEVNPTLENHLLRRRVNEPALAMAVKTLAKHCPNLLLFNSISEAGSIRGREDILLCRTYSDWQGYAISQIEQVMASVAYGAYGYGKLEGGATRFHVAVELLNNYRKEFPSFPDITGAINFILGRNILKGDPSIPIKDEEWQDVCEAGYLECIDLLSDDSPNRADYLSFVNTVILKVGNLNGEVFPLVSTADVYAALSAAMAYRYALDSKKNFEAMGEYRPAASNEFNSMIIRQEEYVNRLLRFDGTVIKNNQMLKEDLFYKSLVDYKDENAVRFYDMDAIGSRMRETYFHSCPGSYQLAEAARRADEAEARHVGTGGGSS